MPDITQWVRNELYENSDNAYKNFHSSLVPGISNIMGVRVPKLREIAKKVAKNDYKAFIENVNIEIYEELMIWGIVLGYIKLSCEERKKELEQFIPHINNWAICDCSCATCKFMREFPRVWFPFVKGYLTSTREYEVRFAVVCLLDFFINEEYIDQVLELLLQIHHNAYYVKMAVAWAISICYIKFPKKTEKLFEENLLDDFIHNKSIQKIRESYRVPKESKERLQKMRRK